MSTLFRAAKIASLTLIALAFAVVNAHQSGPVDHGERHDHDNNSFTADIVLNNMCHHGWSCNGYDEWVAGYDAFPSHNRNRSVVPVKSDSVENVAPKLVSNIGTSDTPVCPLPKSQNLYCNRERPGETCDDDLEEEQERYERDLATYNACKNEQRDYRRKAYQESLTGVRSNQCPSGWARVTGKRLLDWTEERDWFWGGRRGDDIWCERENRSVDPLHPERWEYQHPK